MSDGNSTRPTALLKHPLVVLKPIRVRIQRFLDRPALQLQWTEPVTGKRCTRSAGTADPNVAETARSMLQRELNSNVGLRRRPGTRPRKWKPRYGCVYLLGANGGMFKIGKSQNPELRASHLQTSSHVPLTLVHRVITDDMPWLERLWHDRFFHQWVRGEWYSLDQRQVERFVAVVMWNRGERPVRGFFIDDPWYEEW